MSKLVKCDICGQEVKNLGVHKYHNHKTLKAHEFITDKEFAATLSQLKDILKRYRHNIETTIIEEDGHEKQARLLITIQMK